MNTINIQDVQALPVLEELHQKAKQDVPAALFSLPKLVGFNSADSENKAEKMKGLYLAVNEEQGSLLYTLAKGLNAKHIVEFGCSFGISTIYLALAARANNGKVITTELNADKCRATRANLTRAGLADWVEIRQGEAMATLSNYQAGIDFMFLDGWKDLYLLIFRSVWRGLDMIRSAKSARGGGPNVDTPFFCCPTGARSCNSGWRIAGHQSVLG